MARLKGDNFFIFLHVCQVFLLWANTESKAAELMILMVNWKNDDYLADFFLQVLSILYEICHFWNLFCPQQYVLGVLLLTNNLITFSHMWLFYLLQKSQKITCKRNIKVHRFFVYLALSIVDTKIHIFKNFFCESAFSGFSRKVNTICYLFIKFLKDFFKLYITW